MNLEDDLGVDSGMIQGVRSREVMLRKVMSMFEAVLEK